MTNTNHGLVKTAPARELAFFGAHINLHYLFVLYAGVSIYIYIYICNFPPYIGIFPWCPYKLAFFLFVCMLVFEICIYIFS